MTALTDEEVDLLLRTVWISKHYSNTNKGIFLRWRDATLLWLYFYCGFRPAEATNLKWDMLNFERRYAETIPYFNKQRDDCPVTLTKPAIEALMKFYNACKDLGFHFDFVFPSLESFVPISVDRVDTIIKQMAKEAGILKVVRLTEAGTPKYNVSSYSGRKWFGTKVWRETHSDAAVQALLRHSCRASSEPYILPTQDDISRLADDIFK